MKTEEKTLLIVYEPPKVLEKSLISILTHFQRFMVTLALFSISLVFLLQCSGFNPRSSHTKDSKNGTWCFLA